MDTDTQTARSLLRSFFWWSVSLGFIAGFVFAVAWPDPGHGFGPGWFLALLLAGVSNALFVISLVGWAVSLGIRASGRLPTQQPGAPAGSSGNAAEARAPFRGVEAGDVRPGGEPHIGSTGSTKHVVRQRRSPGEISPLDPI